MKKLISAIFAISVLGTLQAPAAEASGCVTKSEFGKAKTYMSREDVYKLFGAKPYQVSVSRSKGTVIHRHVYSTCAPFSRGKVTIWFVDYILENKTGVFK